MFIQFFEVRVGTPNFELEKVREIKLGVGKWKVGSLNFGLRNEKLGSEFCRIGK
jgi:hypothetical protein